jgi:hypothetical protein
MMPHATGVIDVSAWSGGWPFDVGGQVSLSRLAEHLASAGVAEALVSPLDAVLAPDPMQANHKLLAACEGGHDLPVRLHPVPLVNPLLATWRGDLAGVIDRASGAIPAVRLLPTWHGWGPDHPDANTCLGLLAQLGVAPIIQARMVDERTMPVAATPARFAIEEVVTWLASLPEIPVVLAGLYQRELGAIANLDHVSVDLAFVESGDTLETVLEALPPERVLLGTHAPLLEPLSAVAKLPLAGPHREAAARIGADSARARFGLSS